MKHEFGAIPNFLGEGFAEAMEQQCIALFKAVAVEKDPAKRLALQMRRDSLLMALCRLRADKAKALRRVRRCSADLAANSPRDGWADAGARAADDASCKGACWYCRAPEGNPMRDAIDTLAMRCAAASKKDGRDRRDIFAAALYHFAILHGKDPSLPYAKLVNRSMSWAQHHLMREDYAEHNARERGREGEDYQKWTWRLTDGVVEAVWPGLRRALRADIVSALADTVAFYEDISDWSCL